MEKLDETVQEIQKMQINDDEEKSTKPVTFDSML